MQPWLWPAVSIHIVDAHPNALIQIELTGDRIKIKRIKDDLLFCLIAEHIALTQLSHLFAGKTHRHCKRLDPGKRLAHCGHARLRIGHILRHRVDAIAAIGLNLGVKHRKLGHFARRDID